MSDDTLNDPPENADPDLLERWADQRPRIDMASAWANVQQGAAQAGVPLQAGDVSVRRLVRHSTAPWRYVTWWAAAAVIVIGFVSGTLIWHPSVPAGEYVAAAGQRVAVTLIDGTRVTIAPGSRMHLASDYGRRGRTRRVVLDGEAYFSVAHDAERPFAVDARGVTTRDVGTAFDVRAYAEDPAVRVAVTDGVVAVGGGTLRAGDIATVAATGTAITHNANVATAIGWMQGRLVFDGIPLQRVAQELSRTFGVRITIADSALAADPVSGTFDNQTIAQVLDAITTVVGARYERSGKTFVIRRSALGDAQDRSGAPAPLTTVQASR